MDRAFVVQEDSQKDRARMAWEKELGSDLLSWGTSHKKKDLGIDLSSGPVEVDATANPPPTN